MHKEITAKQVLNNGRRYWRVIVPKDLRHNGAVRRFFSDPEEAQRFTEQLTRQRGNITGRLLALPESDQLNILQALQRVGHSQNLLRAVETWNGHALNRMTVADLVKECIESKSAAGNRPRSIQSLKCTLEQFQTGVGVSGVCEVTPALIEKWLTGSGWSVGTRRGYLTDVRTMFSFAMKRDYLASNPAKAVDKPKSDRPPAPIHTPKQAKKVLKAARDNDPGLLGYLAPLYFGGLRPNEAAKIGKPKNGLIDVTPEIAKGRQRRFVPVNETLATWLKVRGVEYAPKNLKRRLQALRKGLKSVTFPHNVLRHSFCSYALPVFGALKTAEWAGHSEQILFAHYRARVRPDDAKAFWALRP